MAQHRMAAAALVLATAIAGGSAAVHAQDTQPAIDGCINQIRQVGGPDAEGGTVLEQSWSEAGTLLRLRDRGGTVWECIGYDDGTVGDLRVVDAADDGGGAMAGAETSARAVSGTERVSFDSGSSGTQMTAVLDPGTSVRYVLGAREGQFLNVDVKSQGGALDYRIVNPDGSNLLDLIASDTPYEGQLWQSGDHMVEVSNSGAQPVTFDIGIGIR